MRLGFLTMLLTTLTTCSSLWAGPQLYILGVYVQEGNPELLVLVGEKNEDKPQGLVKGEFYYGDPDNSLGLQRLSVSSLGNSKPLNSPDQAGKLFLDFVHRSIEMEMDPINQQAQQSTDFSTLQQRLLQNLSRSHFNFHYNGRTARFVGDLNRMAVLQEMLDKGQLKLDPDNRDYVIRYIFETQTGELYVIAVDPMRYPQELGSSLKIWRTQEGHAIPIEGMVAYTFIDESDQILEIKFGPTSEVATKRIHADTLPQSVRVKLGKTGEVIILPPFENLSATPKLIVGSEQIKITPLSPNDTRMNSLAAKLGVRTVNSQFCSNIFRSHHE